MSLSFLLLQSSLSVITLLGEMHNRENPHQNHRAPHGRLAIPLTKFRSWFSLMPLGTSLSLFGLWFATFCVYALHLPIFLPIALWMISLAGAVWYGGESWKMIHLPRQASPAEVQRRLLQLQHQLQKLHEREILDVQLEKMNQSQQILNRYGEHFKRVLMTIENHLIYGEHEHAERVITVFSRHLRQLLHEGSTPFLALSESIEHIKTHLEMMTLLTGHRFLCDVDDDMLDDETRSRCTERFQLSPWVEECMWPYFGHAERSLKEMPPLTLVIDAADDRVILAFVGVASNEAATLPKQMFRLLGSSQ